MSQMVETSRVPAWLWMEMRDNVLRGVQKHYPEVPRLFADHHRV